MMQHFTATGIVFNRENKVLMIKHRNLRVWLPPGGHIEENELPGVALLREILEETGVTATIAPNNKKLNLMDCNNCKELEIPFVILLEDIENEMHKHIDLVYLCVTDKNVVTPNENEVTDIGWFSLEQIAQLDTYENVRKTLCQAFIEKSRVFE